MTIQKEAVIKMLRNSWDGKTEFKLEPEAYQKILNGLQLLDIEVISCKLENLLSNSDKSSLKVDVNSDATMESCDENQVSVMHQYTLRAKEGRAVVLKINATYHLKFRSNEPISSEFFEIYREINLVKHTWPFFRELVNSLSGRTNQHKLTLPLLI